MKIDRRFLHYKNRATFEEDLREGNIPQSAIVFVDEGRTIYTHGEEYAGDYTQSLELYLKKDEALEEYAKKEDIPEVPKNISEFLNDAGYLTEHLDLSNYALKTDVPEVPTNVSAFINDAGYLTQHQDLSNYALKSDIPAEQDLSQYALKTDIPALLDLSLYALKTDIPEGQDLSLYALKADVPTIQDMSLYALKTDIPEGLDLSEYLKADAAEGLYVKKEDYTGTDEEARSLAQEAKDKADLAYTKAEDAEGGLSSKQDKLTAGDGIIINNNVISLRDVSDGVDSMEALIASIELAFRLFLNVLRKLFVLRKDVYDKTINFGNDEFDPIDVRIAFPYFYVIDTTLYAENTPAWEDETFIVPENVCELLDDLLILH